MSRPNSKLPRYVVAYRDRHGKQRVYFKHRINVVLPQPTGSPEFFKAYAETLERDAKLKGGTKGDDDIKARHFGAGTVDAAVLAYFASTTFKVELRESTQYDRARVLKNLAESYGPNRVAHIRREDVEKWIASKADKPGAARHFAVTIKHWLDYCVTTLCLMKESPAAMIKLPSLPESDGYHCWTEDEIATYRKRHATGTNARTSMELALATGQRISDVAKMGRQHLRDGGKAIFVKQKKTGWQGEIPLHAELRTALKASPANNLTFLINQYGKPYTEAGLGGQFRDWCDEAGLPQCSMHGLRKACATRLAEAGATAHQIMSILGFTLREAERYTRAAEQKKMAKAGAKLVRVI